MPARAAAAFLAAMLSATVTPLSIASPRPAEEPQKALGAADIRIVEHDGRRTVHSRHKAPGLPPPSSSTHFVPWYAEMLQSQGFTVAAGTHIGPEQLAVGPMYIAFPTGDFDGDGLDDVAVADLREDNGPVGFVRLSARKGASGALLWQRDAQDADLVALTPAPTGPVGDPGLVLLRVHFPKRDVAAVVSDELILDVESIDAAGRTVWRQTRAFSSGPYFAAPLMVITVQQALPSAAAEVVLGSGVFAGPVGVGDGSVTVETLDGADGSPRTLQRTASGLEPCVLPLGDLDGDGFDDVAVHDDRYGTQAYSGRTAEPLWHSQVGCFSQDIGDVTGDGREDVILESFRYTTLYDGRTGSTRWGVEGVLPRRLGDVDSEGRADIGLQQVVESSEIGVIYRVLSSDGREIGRDEFTVPRSRDGYNLAIRGNIGDADGDGSDDAAHYVRTWAGLETTVEAGVVSAATGKKMWSGYPVGTASDGTIDGHGIDVVHAFSGEDPILNVHAFDGQTGDLIWSTRVSGDPYVFKFVRSADLDGDGRADPIVNTWSAVTLRSRWLVLRGSDGAVSWSSDSLNLPRTEEKSYGASGGEVVVTGSAPLILCESSGPSAGGACFSLVGGGVSADVRIKDASGLATSGRVYFKDGYGDNMPGTSFCGTSGPVVVPPLAVRMVVAVPAIGSCKGPSAATSGRIVVGFA